jgi:molybdate transport system ATP-binding protein
MPEHRFEHLRWPDDQPVIDIDELVIEDGERLVLFGPNGSGKTTAIRLMAGTIGDTRPEGIAYLPQRPYLFRGTARANLELGLDDVERRRAEDLAIEFGVADRLDVAARSLSGGERMRIALARTLASDADIVLLDEPLAPLDHRDREHTASTIAAALHGRSAVIVSHDRASAAILGDALAVVVDGRIRQRGRIAEVFTTPIDDVVAGVVGVSNVLSGVAVTGDGALVEVEWQGRTIVAAGSQTTREKVKILFGGEAVAVHRDRPDGASPRNLMEGTITGIRTVGRLLEIVVDCGDPVAALITPGSFETLDLHEGSVVYLSVKAVAMTAVSVGDAE